MKKVQVVTGGTSGMGLCTAIDLGKYGPVFVGGRSEKRIEDALETLKDAGVEAYGHTCDISDLDSLAAFAKAAQEIGEINNVVNAAGVDFDVSTHEQMVHINMGGTINVVNTFMPLMKGGSLVNYSSITGYFFRPSEEELAVWNDPDAPDFEARALEEIVKHPNPQAGMLPDEYMTYAGTKAFVIHYTKANAVRFGARGLRIFSVAPGSFMTPMLEHQADNLERIAQGTAFKRVGKPEEMAKMIAALVDPELEYLTGCDVIMDGGKSAMALTKQLA